MEKPLRDLAKDTSVTILPADKGRAVVVMNTNDYTDKINNLLNDDKTYHKITDKRRNPTSSTEKSLNKLLLQIKDQPVSHDSSKKQLEPKLYYKLHSTDSTPASFYGLPKIHKENVPIRPIMSAIGSPTYELSKYLANILSPLQNNEYTVKNSASFVEKIRTLSVDPDEILVSFDVVSLFTYMTYMTSRAFLNSSYTPFNNIYLSLKLTRKLWLALAIDWFLNGSG